MSKPDLDGLDRRLLAELLADARMPQAALGARLGLSRSAIQARIQRLEREGVIQGYTGVAAVDEKHQIIVEAQAHGVGQEQVSCCLT